MSYLFRPTVVRDGKREKSRVWWGVFRVPGRPKPSKISTGTEDRTAARIILKRAERDAVLHADDPHRDAKLTPLVDFLAPFREHVSRRASARQTELTVGRVRRVLETGRFEFWQDLTADRAEAAIADLKAKQRGRNANRATGVSARTANFYRSAVKRFAQWLCTSGRFASNPLAGLSGENVRVDARHDRRALSDAEAARLIDAARAGSELQGMPAAERATLYEVALTTGLRRTELATLTWTCVRLDDDPPTIVVRAGYSKHRREDRLPLKASTAQLLARWRKKTRGADSEAAFPHFTAETNAAAMIRGDLKAARAAWIAEAGHDAAEVKRRTDDADFLQYRDSDGRFADFHGLRHTFVSSLARAGVHPKVAQTLARHCTIALTMDRYTHTVMGEQAAALEALPDVSPDVDDERGAEPMRATGTTDSVAAPVAARDDKLCSKVANSDRRERGGGKAKNLRISREIQRFATVGSVPGTGVRHGLQNR